MEAMIIAAATSVKALGALQQGRAASAQRQGEAHAYDYNAAVSRNNADVALQQSSAAEEQQRRQARDLEGKAIAAAAESGAGLDGSNGDVIRQSAVAAELDALTIRYEGQMKARGLMAQAELDSMQAQASRSAAKSAMKGAYLSAGAELLSGAAMAYGVRPKTPKGFYGSASGGGVM